jgi:hypothetical protein
MVRSGGLLAFVIGASVYIFGFLLLSLVLSMIYDTYQEHMMRMHVFRPSQHEYYAGESEFTFDAHNTPVCTRSALVQPLERQLVKTDHKIQQELKDDPSTSLSRVFSHDATQADRLFTAEDEALMSNWMMNFNRPACQPFDSHLAHNMQLVRRNIHSTVLSELTAPEVKPKPIVGAAVAPKSQTVKKQSQLKKLLKPDFNLFQTKMADKLAPKPSKSRLNVSIESDENIETLGPKLQKFLLEFFQSNVSSNRSNRIREWFRVTAIDLLQRVTTSRIFLVCIDGLILFKLLLFVLQIECRVLMVSSEEKQIVSRWFDVITSTIALAFLGEFAVRLLAGGSRMLKSRAFCFEVTVVLIDLALYHFTSHSMHVFSNIRLWRLLYFRWPLLQLMASAIAASKLELSSNLALFTVVFGFFTIFANRFFKHFQVENEEEDFLRLE